LRARLTATTWAEISEHCVAGYSFAQLNELLFDSTTIPEKKQLKEDATSLRMDQLLNFIQSARPYLDPEITLHQLAA